MSTSKQDNNQFPLEKILTISAREYAETRCLELSEYIGRGVQYFSFTDEIWYIYTEFATEIAEQISQNVEAVVDVKTSLSSIDSKRVQGPFFQ